MKKVISYHHVEGIFNVLLDKIKATERKFTHVYAPPNGGLPLSAHFANHLGLKNIVGDMNAFAEYIQCNYSETIDWNVLILDDVCDTGKTFIEIKETLSLYGLVNETFVSMFLKHRSAFLPDICYEEVTDDTWLIFPWEPVDGADEDQKDYEERRGLE